MVDIWFDFFESKYFDIKVFQSVGRSWYSNEVWLINQAVLNKTWIFYSIFIDTLAEDDKKVQDKWDFSWIADKSFRVLSE